MSPHVGAQKQGKFLWEGGSTKPSKGRLEFLWGSIKTTASSTWFCSKELGAGGTEMLRRISQSRYPYYGAKGRRPRVEQSGALRYLE